MKRLRIESVRPRELPEMIPIVVPITTVIIVAEIAINNEIRGNGHGRCRGFQVVRLGPVLDTGTSIGALGQIKISRYQGPSGAMYELVGISRE